MKRQLHNSGLLRLFQCGVYYENRYLKGMRLPAGPRAVVGTAVDKAVCEDLSNKKACGELLSDEQVQEIARDVLVREWSSNEITVTGEDLDEGWAASKGQCIDASVEMASYYHRAEAPGVQPKHVQRPWTLDIQGLDIQLVGTMDIDEGRKIRDLKTRQKSPKKTEADESLQLTTYSLAKLSIDGYIPDSVQLDIVVRTPARHDLKLVKLEAKRTEESLQPLINRIESAHKIINSGLFTPCDPSFWLCTQKYCGFWNTCPYALRPVSVSVPAQAQEAVTA